LSPFLFILGIEVFSRLLFKEERNGCINGLIISRNCTAIHHLLFDDDLLMFGKAFVSEATYFKSCLDKYCSWSGQSISSPKSSIRFSKNTNLFTTDSILNIFPYSTNHSKPSTLACQFSWETKKKRAFQDIIDKVLSRIEGWRAKTLSQACKLLLIKSVAATLSFYAMSSFLPPISCCKELDKAFKKFWWGFPSKKTRNLSLKA
jgi:hypothetical protein